MNRFFTTLLSLLFVSILVSFGQNNVTIYNPNADAESDLKTAITTASETNKHILVEIGGNWCPWCIRLNQFVEADTQIDSLLKADYIVVKINYSKENKNEVMLSALEYPQRFGFPVLLILNSDGKRIHTQNSGYLEEDKGYSKEKVFGFLKDWRPSAINPLNYTK